MKNTMTQITYKNEIMTISQSNKTIEFKIADLNYESRRQLINSTLNINGDK
jgi:hypothetical protein